jgi:hypothetical protein
MIETGFEQFWSAYPRRKEKFRAHTAYDKALKHALHEEIMAGVRRYAAEVRGKDQRYVKHPATWLNAGCWLDYEPDMIAAIALNMPRAFKCPDCFQVTIGTACEHCRRMTA